MDTKKQEKIKKEARHILDKFAKALEKVETKEENFYVDREDFERKEGNGEACEKDFKRNMLKNAPEHEGDFIIVEKGNWK